MDDDPTGGEIRWDKQHFFGDTFYSFSWFLHKNSTKKSILYTSEQKSTKRVMRERGQETRQGHGWHDVAWSVSGEWSESDRSGCTNIRIAGAIFHTRFHSVSPMLHCCLLKWGKEDNRNTANRQQMRLEQVLTFRTFWGSQLMLNIAWCFIYWGYLPYWGTVQGPTEFI